MKAPTNILVPVDFGEVSEAALEYALAIAEVTGGRITLLHAYEVPVIGLSDAVASSNIADLAERIRDAANKALDETRARHATGKVPLTAELRNGDARHVILAQAEAMGADLIVLGTHGRRGLARALIGSVAESVVRSSPVPVLTVHAADAKP